MVVFPAPQPVQTIVSLAHLAEEKNIWGPFLVVAPASTLHNWEQEFRKFTPDFKVLPYWGTQQQRKILRRDWNPQLLNCKDAPFHVVITSYQMVVSDDKQFQKLHWQYMVNDEAQVRPADCRLQCTGWRECTAHGGKERAPPGMRRLILSAFALWRNVLSLTHTRCRHTLSLSFG